MADNDVVRDNPLPVGRYWVIITGKDNIAQFDQWLAATTKSGALTVNSTQVISESGILRSKADVALLLSPILGALIAKGRAEDPDQEFIVFTVTQPNSVMWLTALGLPSKAGANVTIVDDVEQAPPPAPNPIDQLDAGLNKAITTIEVIGGILAVVLGLNFLLGDRRK